MRFALQLLAVAVAAFATDVIACWHILALVHGSTAFAVGTIVLLNLAAFPFHHWFVNQPTTRARLLLTLAGAIGAGLGTLTVRLFA